MKDGGGRIALEFGNDAIDAVVQIQKLHSAGEQLFALAIVPITNETSRDEIDEFKFEDPFAESSQKTAKSHGKKR